MNLTEIENAGGEVGVFSDLHKDCFGFRPRGAQFDSLAAFNAEFDRLANVVLPRVREEEEALKRAKVAEFEQAILRTMEVIRGCSRLRAIEILAEADDCKEDWEHFEWKLGVPFGYVSSQMGA